MTTESINFVTESNRIEGIMRTPTQRELDEHDRFMSLNVVTISELEKFVKVYQPDARLRDKEGLNVRVGNYIPPKGGLHIRDSLFRLLDCLNDCTAYENHIKYETIHPFTDGNGRSGRMLWAWQMRRFPLGFLHHFYYQTLQASGERK
jgi:hypothetical protein